MQNRLLGYTRRIVFFCSLLFALQTTAQTVITYHNKDIETSKDYVKGNDYQKDFLLFMDMLQTTHPAFEKGAPINVKKELKQGYKSCGKCESQEAFVYTLQQVAAKMHDGHTGLQTSLNSDVYYPMHFYIDDKGMYLDAVLKGMESSLGKQVLKISGKDMSFIYEQFRGFFSTTNDVDYKKTFKNYSNSYYLWKELGLCEQDSSITLSFADGNTLKLKPIKIQNKDISKVDNKSQVQQMRLRAGGMPFSFQILDGGICYMLFDQCADRNTLRQQYLPQVAGNEKLLKRLEQQLKRIPVFTEFLDSMFQTMATQNVKTLVVDVRENSGGNSTLCDELLCRLKSSIIGPRVSVRPSHLAEAYYQAAGLDKSLLYSTTDTHSRLQGLASPFQGNVIFVQGERTFSSAGLLMTMAIDNNIGIAIGEPASYAPTHYGDMISWSLPNTQTKGYISHKCFVRPDETKGQDIPLANSLSTSFQDYQKGIDPCFNWVMENFWRQRN
ncbi:S41 family peptidase [uncultured Prevotella sp.]|uniref:S41 family peptidase n=1 Tax=uncultured Prevotella sp. TaxID=159272 RepID=UPI00258F8F0B|nr:S41 family peptidase [uncultured Prevotella sp.]